MNLPSVNLGVFCWRCRARGRRWLVCRDALCNLVVAMNFVVSFCRRLSALRVGLGEHDRPAGALELLQDGVGTWTITTNGSAATERALVFFFPREAGSAWAMIDALDGNSSAASTIAGKSLVGGRDMRIGSSLAGGAVQAQDNVFKFGVTRYTTHSKTSGVQGIGLPPGADAVTGDATTAGVTVTTEDPSFCPTPDNCRLTPGTYVIENDFSSTTSPASPSRT